MYLGFWDKLKKPLIGLAPMDGVTDAAFRYAAAKYGGPSVIFTEFVSVEGLIRGVGRLFDDLIYAEIERPVVAQVFGSNPQSFYQASFLIALLGFDGLDVNMGCPEKSVSGKQGAGAGLILKPKLAQEIIKACKRGVEDYVRGKDLAELGISEDILSHPGLLKRLKISSDQRRVIPVSVKTRLGVDHTVIKDWVKNLLETELAAITIHGRTLRQMYSGEVDWASIALAAEISRGSGTFIIGNGGIKDFRDAVQKIELYRLDGVLIGRASYGNPWIFCRDGKKVSVREKLKALVGQSEYFVENLRSRPFLNLRKHFSWYCRNFRGAAMIREELMKVKDLDEMKQVIGSYVKEDFVL